MSSSFYPQNEQTAEQALKVQQLKISGLDPSMYQLTSGSAFTISAISASNPAVVTTSSAHGLSTGQVVALSGTNSSPSANGFQSVTVIDSTHFSIPLAVTLAGTSGSSAGAACYLMVREPIDRVYQASVKVDSSNTTTLYNQAAISIVDSQAGLSGQTDPATVPVSDRGAVLLSGLVSLANNDIATIDYTVLAHL